MDQNSEVRACLEPTTMAVELWVNKSKFSWSENGFSGVQVQVFVVNIGTFFEAGWGGGEIGDEGLKCKDTLSESKGFCFCWQDQELKLKKRAQHQRGERYVSKN
ncbi:hypothetical protein ABZP36_012136 [Zizania latifolia]